MSYMAMESVSYTMRMPSDLKRLMEQRAKSEDVSTASLVVRACWQLLDPNPFTPPDVPAAELEAFVDTIPGRIIGNPNPFNIPGVFRGMPPVAELNVIGTEPQERCSYTEYDTDTGETYGCRLLSHPAKVKHRRGAAL